ncbi:MAG: RNA 2',3'-cyclic phosphodiesterase [Pseudomonadota bacterium]
MIRSFLAIELPEALKAVISGYIQALRQVPSAIKWGSTHQTHLTLKFFGSIAPETVERISRVLERIVSDYPRFNLFLKGIGAFPNLFRPRVIWTGLQGDTKSLQGFHRVIEQALVPLGIPGEERPFHPHLTLGRNKLNQMNEPLFRLLSHWPEKESPSFRVEEVILFRSDLKPGGPVYTKLGVFPLKQDL